jgi:hypothetical protein
MAVIIKQSTGTYASAGTGASYFANTIYEAVSSEILISVYPSRAIIYTNG